MSTDLAADLRLLSHRICDDTRDHVVDYASCALIQRMCGGTLTRDAYAAWLGQQLLIHERLDALILSHRSSVAPLRLAVDDFLLMGKRARADLDAMGISPDTIEPGGATMRVLASMDAAGAHEPLKLFGHHYVRQGLVGIHRYAAARLRAALGGDAGYATLDPFSRGASAMWARFNRDANKFSGTEHERQAIVLAANELIGGLIAVNNEIEGAPVPDGERVAVPSTF